MNRQELLDNFVRATNGKGRAVLAKGSICSYFPEGHPGCSIGCQPGFRERFKGRMRDERAIKYWLRKTEPANGSGDEQLAADLMEFFGLDDDQDIEFLSALQLFHDATGNWIGLGIDPKSLAVFCETWLNDEGNELQVPRM